MATKQATKCNITRDANSYPIVTPDVGFPFSTLTQSIKLTQNVSYTLTVPLNGSSTVMVAIIKYTDDVDVWVSSGATAPTIPTVATITVLQELCPHTKEVKAGDTLHFLTGSATTTYVNVAYYALPSI